MARQAQKSRTRSSSGSAESAAEKIRMSDNERMELDGVLASLPGDVVGGAIRQRLNCARGLAAGRDQTTAIHEEQIRNIVCPVIAVDNGGLRIVAHTASE